MFSKRKKLTRYRGSKTHGCGSMKKRRGAGHRGGRGMSGSGKRGDQKKPSTWNTKYFGKYGFKSIRKKEVRSINISFIEEKFNKLLANKMIIEENGVYVIDLAKLKFDKLLGTGKPTRKYKILAKYASNNAIEKIKKTGGDVVVLDKELEEKVVKDNKKE